eukprot:CAMPEP_0177772308 /NCGR_PEP_ID=MMETSP0491_2-20121128/12146_1 /TAXON_ID=63592 /ORGANISM="Tetraselmis chuii, Strain PLY429" /LENGTH=155 /DNA_ID=CAMNT_0019290095 /DNA_START=207 /DNA_END=674 /DNA_ORIENTATION=-
MGADISKRDSRAQGQSLEARVAEAERALREAQERVLRLELQAQVGQQRHAEAGDQRGIPESPEARIAGAERAENREVSEERLTPQLFRTQREVNHAARGEAVAIGQLAAKGTTENDAQARQELEANIHLVGEGYRTEVSTQSIVRAGEAKSGMNE